MKARIEAVLDRLKINKYDFIFYVMAFSILSGFSISAYYGYKQLYTFEKPKKAPSLFWDETVDKPSPMLAKVLNLYDIPADGGIDHVVQTTQKKWLRTKERWNVQDGVFDTQIRQDLTALFNQLGLTELILPSKNSYKSALVLGARVEAFVDRIKHAVSRINSGNIKVESLTLLTGRRALIKEEKEFLKQTFNITGIHDERTMADELAKQLIPETISYTVVKADAPGTMPRATTACTIAQWLTDCCPRAQAIATKDGESKPKKDIHLLVSSQPHAYYQLLSALNILEQHQRDDIELDVCSEKQSQEKDNMVVRVHLDALARILYNIREHKLVAERNAAARDELTVETVYAQSAVA
ncbi:MAG: hypothetical protein H6679_02080 [Epsilonproteobacteria bacterium]|nr:hypothetical protein [Campylobacterota bacterium]